jgi:two-component system chemotaxis response regulator CheY
MPTAVIVDDSPVIRLQLRHILANIGVTVVAEAGCGGEAEALYATHRPSLMTLDVIMPGKNGTEVAVDILRAYPDARIVMCSSFNTYEKIMTCKRAGVRHYLLKPFDNARAQTIFQFALDELARPTADVQP